jgi:hypothetical protein
LGLRAWAGGEQVLGRDRDRTAAVGADERRGRLAPEGFDAWKLGVVEPRPSHVANLHLIHPIAWLGVK